MFKCIEKFAALPRNTSQHHGLWSYNEDTNKIINRILLKITRPK